MQRETEPPPLTAVQSTNKTPMVPPVDAGPMRITWAEPYPIESEIPLGWLQGGASKPLI